MSTAVVNATSVTAAASRVFGIVAGAARHLEGSFGHDCWLVSAAGHDFLLKIPVRRAARAHFDGEVAAHRLVQHHGLPVPDLVATCYQPNELGADFFIQRWVNGTTGDLAAEAASVDSCAPWIRTFGETVARMHAIPGPWFSKSVTAIEGEDSWVHLARSSLARLVSSVVDQRLFEPAFGLAVERRATTLIDALTAKVEPALTHADVHLANTVVDGDRFVALLDFEHGRFFDPLWDFAKLDAWVFRRYPRFAAPFLDGYVSVVAWPSEADDRVGLCRCIEYLSQVEYFGSRFPSRAMLLAAVGDLRAWLSSTTYRLEWMP